MLHKSIHRFVLIFTIDYNNQEVRTKGILESDAPFAFVNFFLQGGAVYDKHSLSPASALNTHYLRFK